LVPNTNTRGAPVQLLCPRDPVDRGFHNNLCKALLGGAHPGAQQAREPVALRQPRTAPHQPANRGAFTVGTPRQPVKPSPAPPYGRSRPASSWLRKCSKIARRVTPYIRIRLNTSGSLLCTSSTSAATARGRRTRNSTARVSNIAPPRAPFG